MKEQLITFDTAKLAKEKGFDWIPEFKNVYSVYNCWGIHSYDSKIKNLINLDNKTLAPTQSLLQKWLRDVHKIDVWCERFSTEERWIYQCPKLNIGRINYYSDVYEEALEEGL